MTATPQFESNSISLPQPVPAQSRSLGRENEEAPGEEEGCEEEEEEEKEKEEAALSDISDDDFKESGRVKPSLSEEASSPTESKSLEKKLSEELEDILYLRLIALRSMNIPGDLSPESSSKSIEDEMTELLEEADQAATEAIPPPPIIDIADSEEEKMDFYMKTMTTNLSFMSPIKVKEEMEEDFNLLLNDVPQEEKEGPFYSPTQSPVKLSSPESPPDEDEECGSKDEAEKKFFKDQKEESSPWGKTLQIQLYNCDPYQYLYQEERKPPLPLVKKAPPKKRLRKRKSQRVASSSDEEEELARKSNKTKSTLRMPSSPESEDEEAMRAHLLSSIAAKREEKQKRKKKEDPPLPTAQPPLVAAPPLPPQPPSRKVNKPRQVELPFEKLKKYFPNMVRPFIVPLNIPTSSEDEDTGGGGDAFQANLNLFMKNARQGTLPKRIPPPKPARKHPPRSKVPPHNSSSLLLNNKTHPIRKQKHTDSIIEHLPLERQKEYKMLLARIANKEKKKKIQLQQQQQKNHQKSNVEDPEEMRRLLLSKMKSLKSKIEQNKSNLQKTMTVSSTQESSKENNVPDKRLPSAERDVISSRGEVVSGLFKLSAQLSQFRSESEKLLTAQSFLLDLLKQVEETKSLIQRKEERIATLRHVVKLSHISMSKKRKELEAKEFHCKSLGGEGYTLPETGAQQIKNKLTQIASNAKLCKKVNLSSSSSNGNNKEISGLSSSIDHLKGSVSGLDPHTELCRFQLLGKCNDDACPYQHHHHQQHQHSSSPAS
eukprot:TRINITY_DN2251_c0_g1_i4.p1 TRINITY_DN2251_c0_g1~~TRINITY_DN2251_c0_g1_i4.p1  ORF type:complete len:770 (+),score=356.93 TRINITY_DN2251_c0_g1_i4:184-2493(+)